MPRQLEITPALVAEVAGRRAKGEAWKRIAADLRRRGLPFGVTTYWRAGVSKRQDGCASPQPGTTRAT